MQRLVQVLLDRADDESADGLGVADAHLGFRRMDVDVDLGRIAFNEERRHRMPTEKVAPDGDARRQRRCSKTGSRPGCDATPLPGNAHMQRFLWY
jgi:hypothetical protein